MDEHYKGYLIFQCAGGLWAIRDKEGRVFTTRYSSPIAAKAALEEARQSVVRFRIAAINNRSKNTRGLGGGR